MASGMGFRKGVKSFIFKWLIIWCKNLIVPSCSHMLCIYSVMNCLSAMKLKNFILKGQAHEILHEIYYSIYCEL